MASKAKALKEQAKQKLKQEEQKLRQEALFAKQKAEQARAEAKRHAFENDPRNIAKARQFGLRKKYGLSSFIEKAHFPKLMNILHRLDDGGRLSEEEIVWLSTENSEYEYGTGYFTRELREKYHKNEAKIYTSEFEKGKDPWSAVNASSHYRKCKQAEKADSMLNTIDVSSLKNSKLKSALCTTHGGVKRDLEKWEEALFFGNQAHLLTPQNFKPCTLLGAVNIEIGNYDLGQLWYKKAIDRGYSEKSMDAELRSIFMRSDKSKQKALREHLLKIDPYRYRWTKEKSDKMPNKKFQS